MSNLLWEKLECPDYHKRKHDCLEEIHSNMIPAIQHRYGVTIGKTCYKFGLTNEINYA